MSTSWKGKGEEVGSIEFEPKDLPSFDSIGQKGGEGNSDAKDPTDRTIGTVETELEQSAPSESENDEMGDLKKTG